MPNSISSGDFKVSSDETWSRSLHPQDEKGLGTDKVQTLASVERALAILQTFRVKETQLSANEFIQRTGLGKATASTF